MSGRALAAAKQSAAAQVTPVTGAVLHRQCACGQHTAEGECEECKGKKNPLQPKPPKESSAGEVPPIVQDVLRSPGQPLNAETRTFMEPRFGHDFSGVRVHTDAQAAESARILNAQAYTVGRDLVFGAGEYAPESPPGRRLLAHELTHIIQQNSLGPHSVRMAESELEHEADRASAVALQGKSPSVLSTVPAGVLQRQAKTGEAEPSTPVRKGPKDNPNAGRGGSRFDANLDREASVLVITMRLEFQFKNSPLAEHPWTEMEKVKFKGEFIRENAERWSERYVLSPNTACPEEPMKHVSVQVIPVEDDARPHRTFAVDNSSMLEKSGVSPSENTGHLNIGDVAAHPKTESGTVQTTAEHEFGHALGLHHISCPGNQPECYGPSGSPEEKDIMGKGSDVSIRDYEVFSEVLNDMTGCTWHAEEKPSSFWKVAGIVSGILALGGLVALGIGLASKK